MAKKTPAKKSAKPVKKAPVKAPAKALKSSTPLRKPAKTLAAKPKSKAAPVKKISKPASKPAVNKVAKKPTPKPVVKKTPAKPVAKAAPKAAAKPVSKVVPKTVAKASVKSTKAVASKAPTAKKATATSDRVLAQQFVRKPKANSQAHMTPFLIRQRQRLLELKDTLLDSMRGVARDNLHAGSETSAFGMHQADAGSDAYDRDFALSMLSKEQGSLYEIDEALKRIEDGTYGVCDICEKPIRHDRLEALPFTRYTVECQAELEKRQHHHSVRPHINSLFGLTEEEAESEEEDTADNS